MTINPFTLKELRQLTRARAISGSLIAFLAVSAALAYFIPVGMADSQSGSVVFTAVNALLWLMIGAIIPHNVYMRLTAERGGAKKREDFTLFAAVTPAAIVDGKLRSAFALMALFASATFPFCVFAYLMHGVTFSWMARHLATTVCFSCLNVHAALAIASFKARKSLRDSAFALLMLNMVIMPFVHAVSGGGLGATPLTVAAVATICLLLRAYAIAGLTPAVMDRDRDVKLATLAAMLGWGGYVAASGCDDVLFRSVATGGVLVFAAYAFSLPVGYSRRMLAEKPKSAWRRIFGWPLRTGAANGFVFAIFLAFLLAMSWPGLRAWDLAAGGERLIDAFRMLDASEFDMATCFLYVFAMLLAVRAVWRLVAGSADVSPLLVPILAFVLLVFMQSLPYLVEMEGWQSHEACLKLPFNIHGGISFAPRWHLACAGAAFGAGLLLNLAALVKAFRAEACASRKDGGQTAPGRQPAEQAEKPDTKEKEA